ncbi:phage major capsid protein [Paenibacillus spongiae]|uniref:Phage major capsid protein n=1 Tax=Paenibacillus spongiae TaxID=2909671 RepID=A0ABY5SIK0_9BACL|nr:phage major capsid protein [Paenibacillus spongiae]UVI32083.1 phage major capsid protein [Paenibacillus spongiae]
MKRIDELKQQLEEFKAEAQVLLNENKVSDAKTKMEEIKNLKESILIQEQLDAEALEQVQNKMNNQKENKQVENNTKQTANALRAMIKAGMGKSLTEAENALLVPSTGDGANGEGFLLPKDIRTLIVEKIRQYKSFRDVLGYIPTTALTGSFPVEDFETLSELVDFTDGTDGTEPTDIKFKNVAYALKQKGAIIKLSNTLLQMTDNNLIAYIVKVFAKKAVITENKMAIAALQAGKTVKALADWTVLKKSINVDLDEGVKYGCVIVTNQDGYDKLDSIVADGRPLLQPDVTSPNRKMFMGYPVHVFSNALLPTTGTTTKKAPIFYGNLAEAVSFVDNGAYAFATSEHAAFASNMTVARVIEYVDVAKVDASDKIYIAGEITIS